ncbi:hypothetical protein LAJ19_21375 (plasmid) [Deinococcus taeanensis]|uniref:hypothetical protein n=1 Tax=Deinococcus taeanensis TaxID=2737050 RepID=UPI001CDBB54C|nr:hypothetical protein [Deinococcus taeanensis]UBV45538.1 hypothetical protein LAJ19_21375 [Deinococcus taeanensis]
MQPITIDAHTTALWKILKDLHLPWHSSVAPSGDDHLPLGPHHTLSLIHEDDTLLEGFLDLAVSDFFYDLLNDSDQDDPYTVIEQQTREMGRVMHQLSDEAAPILGQPAMIQRLGDPASAGDDEALSLVRWHRPNARITLKIVHDDKELPVRLVVTVTPPSSSAEL